MSLNPNNLNSSTEQDAPAPKTKWDTVGDEVAFDAEKAAENQRQGFFEKSINKIKETFDKLERLIGKNKKEVINENEAKTRDEAIRWMLPNKGMEQDYPELNTMLGRTEHAIFSAFDQERDPNKIDAISVMKSSGALEYLLKDVLPKDEDIKPVSVDYAEKGAVTPSSRLTLGFLGTEHSSHNYTAVNFTYDNGRILISSHNFGEEPDGPIESQSIFGGIEVLDNGFIKVVKSRENAQLYQKATYKRGVDQTIILDGEGKIVSMEECLTSGKSDSEEQASIGYRMAKDNLEKSEGDRRKGTTIDFASRPTVVTKPAKGAHFYSYDSKKSIQSRTYGLKDLEEKNPALNEYAIRHGI